MFTVQSELASCDGRASLCGRRHSTRAGRPRHCVTFRLTARLVAFVSERRMISVRVSNAHHSIPSVPLRVRRLLRRVSQSPIRYASAATTKPTIPGTSHSIIASLQVVSRNGEVSCTGRYGGASKKHAQSNASYYGAMQDFAATRISPFAGRLCTSSSQPRRLRRQQGAASALPNISSAANTIRQRNQLRHSSACVCRLGSSIQ